MRTSTLGTPFSAFLPLALTPSHFRKALPIIRVSLRQLAVGSTGQLTGKAILDVFAALMNQIIVQLMKTCDDARNMSQRNPSVLQASEKALQGYAHLHHLLLSLCAEQPDIATEAERLLNSFLEEPAARDKIRTPNLGHLLVYLLVAGASNGWDKLAQPFLREMLVRNVVFLLDPRHGNRPYLAHMEAEPVSDFRLEQTFTGSRTALRLLMFQVYFLTHIGRPVGKTLTDLRQSYDRQYGVPGEGVSDSLLQAIKTIYTVPAWDKFFPRIGLSVPSKEVFCTVLRNSVKESAGRGYHVCPVSPAELLSLRAHEDPACRGGHRPLKPRSTGVPSFFPQQSRGVSRGRGGARRRPY